jgi:alpha-tubulin suppressor-like RCC1 family protein
MKHTKHILAAFLVLVLTVALVPSAAAATELPIRAGDTITFRHAIKPDNTLWSWTSGTPIKIMDNVQSVEMGYQHLQVVKTDGSLWDDQGTGSFIKLMDDVASIADGGNVVIKKDGSMWIRIDTNAWTKMADDVVDVSLRDSETFVILKKDGTLWYREKETSEATIVQVADNVVSLSGDCFTYSVYVKSDGTVWRFSDDAYPTIKITDNAKATFGQIKGGSGVQRSYNAIIKGDNALYMWGANDYGKLGDGTTTDRDTPIKVMENVACVSLVQNTTTVLTTDGSVYEFGRYSQMTPTKVFDGAKLPSTPAVPLSPTAVADIQARFNGWYSNNLLVVDAKQGENIVQTALKDNLVFYSYNPSANTINTLTLNYTASNGSVKFTAPASGIIVISEGKLQK